MPDIGATLREARLRQRIDISEVEAETKIRAKYLRALENEEWGLLPGSTFAKTFLRTYADYLGLDSKLLTEEYKLAVDPAGPGELTPITPALGGRRERRPPRRRGPSRGVVVGVILAGIVVLLYLVALLGGGGDSTPGTAVPTPAQRPSTGPAAPAPAQRNGRRARVVRLQVVPSGSVWACLVDAAGRRLIDGRTLTAGSPSRTYRSRRFRVWLGNGQVELRIDGRLRTVPDRTVPVGYTVSAAGRRELPAASVPPCA